jgi:D-glycero-D-manno-heptose 1,7-bisphosphate phosphatase
MSAIAPPGAAVFLDRDGTLNVERHYLSRAEEFQLLPGVGPALQRLSEAGFRLFLVTNQSGIGRGYFTSADLERIHDRMRELLEPHGVVFQKI